jgi:regulator of protease activity HflC (stomatin/prohibitin superfamily)
MRVDLNAGVHDLGALPRFQQASGQARQLSRVLLGLAGWAVLALLAAVWVHLFSPDSLWSPLLNLLGAASLLLAGVTQWAWRIARWRGAALAALNPTAATAEPTAPAVAQSAYDRWLDSLIASTRRRLAEAGIGALWLVVATLLAVYLVAAGWRFDPVSVALGQASYVVVAIGLVLAFALLVLERHLTANAPLQWPEAHGLALQLRVTLACLVIGIFCLFMVAAENHWALRLAVIAGVLPGLVAVELLLRAVGSMFSPQRPSLEPQLIADSLLAGLLEWPPRPLNRLQDEMQQRFGIDLRQVWAFGFMRRATLPVLGLMALIGWTLSGVAQVPMSGRGIYERFGKPVEVYGPGLHLGLPWPLGQVRPVENGVVHELATSGDDSAAGERASSDGPAPIDANRLWDAAHPSEKSQVIASAANDRQSFQVVNMDVRFVYRIGLSDQAALAATYHSADITKLLRSTASRVLVHQFAGRTLDDLLGEGRNGLAAAIGAAVQADLARRDSGIELLATVVEAIHPPAGAANAYHAVQAAQISAQALVARERGKASEALAEARMQATDVTDQARAGQAESLGVAQVAQRRFGAEREAWQSAGQAFIDERYFAQLSLALAHGHALIIDHRIATRQPPTLDLRSFPAPLDPAPAQGAAARPAPAQSQE